MRIDTLEGYAGYALATPKPIDLPAVERAAFSAGYTLTGVELQITGRTLSGPCEECDGEVLLLEVDGTHQRFELEGDAPPEARVRVRATASGWKEHHVRWKLLECVELGAEPGQG